ncbi:putative antimicrobial peptide resistance and lipid A acylation protein PagP [Bordetella holmesii CDC-H635-BH]|uniref:Putative antimicrobial peptide resistance and lipid A acylation protein PagP n=1 Tax=Bordetella holmesii CDC-H585-BH TaxID=1331206 RepID=A0A158M3N5_9BORD|nr:putative antimicrobial peptide resistance and lipid A acylation protein PagP [Bordetella holmesii CDC-H809-BH]KAK87528.1 putative antimicrobial peptide resistance and lipid A acylation protein PagP [Bordetella holmesii CDC-H572-BH]KAK90624.1 putative antimicrobial peptide resistance and lipid A acylation protein PagP [Bordetella holmesii CDC-H585-BH]KAK91174.1 putative antimicrobial peptide resistance and lipid A acylation protein PagP [Bordetella holmesii CDC-H635-BH]KCV05694.1 putative ant
MTACPPGRNPPVSGWTRSGLKAATICMCRATPGITVRCTAPPRSAPSTKKPGVAAGGRSLYDEDGDWQGLYAMAFLDSHRKVEPIAGYGFLKIGKVSENFRLGTGYTVFMTARHDIMSYVPFPGILPLVGAGYKDAMLYATYIPGGKGNGNVLFVFGRWHF